MSRADTAMTQGLTAFLQGYGKHDLDGLAAIARYSAWPALAARENERRMARIIESLQLDEVQAIARSEIDLNALARQVLGELDTE
ncbi:hypothetical protein [Achromobacter xylosoxidans]|uniref:hypothetical protein n=1 Tax=Alcaligenes xylosoxydans xylosoxydans TaxID=85698 RepID=UPI00244C47D2|nr:hypothetical protein [Achromobacter xylosoxidans]MDH0519732.1 hypothetical protein [Achromobacter xylosoxidans]MDH0544640.1 hypothetical protein [Achromobacter xylosoxidans]